MNEHSRAKLDAYYAEAASWNRDRVKATLLSQRIAWWIAAASAIIALLEAIALVLLMPLKTVEPYTLMVDKTTGYVQELKPLDPSRIAPDSALTQSFLAQYVIAREGFDIATLNTSYRKVSIFSAGDARSSYLEGMRSSNPSSPINFYPRTSIVDVQVKSISELGKNVAMVRFNTIRGDVGERTRTAQSWVAVIRYRYSDAPMTLEARFVNPLGFLVTSYRKDPEAPSVEQSVSEPEQPSQGGSPTPNLDPYYAGRPAPQSRSSLRS